MSFVALIICLIFLLAYNRNHSFSRVSNSPGPRDQRSARLHPDQIWSAEPCHLACRDDHFAVGQVTGVITAVAPGAVAGSTRPTDDFLAHGQSHGPHDRALHSGSI